MSKIEAKIKITFLDYYNFFCHTDFILNKLVEKKLTFNLYLLKFYFELPNSLRFMFKNY